MSSPGRHRLSFLGKLGVGLVVVACVLWIALLGVPLLPVTAARKALAAAILVVAAEVLFWLGLLLVGPEAARAYRERFRLLDMRRHWDELLRYLRGGPRKGKM